MSGSLEKWAERYLKEVTEQGESTARLRLATTDGTTWGTWEQPFGSPAAVASEIETTVIELVEEWPCQSVQVLVIAEDEKGLARAQWTRTVRGKNKQASTFSGQGKALTDAMSANAVTMQKILDTANVQLDSCTKTLEAQQQALHEAYRYIQLINEKQATTLPSPTKEAAAQLMEQLGENLPTILELIRGLKIKKTTGAVGSNGATAKAIAAGALNGAVSGALQGVASPPDGNA